MDFLIRHFEPNMHWGYNHHVVYMSLAAHTSVFTYHTHTHLHTHVHVHMHTSIHTRVHAHVHMHITHTHIKFLTLLTIPYIWCTCLLCCCQYWLWSYFVLFCFVYIVALLSWTRYQQKCITIRADLEGDWYTCFVCSVLIDFHISHGMHSLQPGSNIHLLCIDLLHHFLFVFLVKSFQQYSSIFFL